jgi:long-chain acyl-CoA synthetase
VADKNWPSLVAMFFAQAERLGDKPLLWAKRDGRWQSLSWRETASRVVRLARALVDAGVTPGDRVIIVSENRPEWVIADFAIMAAGGITVPAYVTNTTSDHQYVLQDSGAKAAIVSTARLSARFLPAAPRAPDLRQVITIEPPHLSQAIGVTMKSWDEAVGSGSDAVADLPFEPGHWKIDDTACIIYTSGTGGAPKGVMLSHGAILHNMAGALDALMTLGLGDEVFLSFLPLSHSYEHTAGLCFPLSIGAQIYYAESVEALGANMAEVRPTIMTAVPRLYELMRGRILKAIEAQGGKKARLFYRTLELGRRRYAMPNQMTVQERITDAALDLLVRRKARARFGGRLKALVSGGAPLNPDVGIFFTALGLCILQGYGQTESAPIISVNRAPKPKMHTVGPLMKDVEVKIAEDGEILVRGALVMKGYWRREEETKAAIVDGWLHTGDIGVFDADGHLQITDRKKDIIVVSGGDNVSPQRIEGMLTMEPEIAQAMVYGDRQPHLVGLLVPDTDWLSTWAKAQGKEASLAALAADPDLHAALQPAVERVNKELSNLEKIRRFAVATEPFSIDNEQMTPTMKIKRHQIRAVYGDTLLGLYGPATPSRVA